MELGKHSEAGRCSWGEDLANLNLIKCLYKVKLPCPRSLHLNHSDTWWWKQQSHIRTNTDQAHLAEILSKKKTKIQYWLWNIDVELRGCWLTGAILWVHCTCTDNYGDVFDPQNIVKGWWYEILILSPPHKFPNLWNDFWIMWSYENTDYINMI